MAGARPSTGKVQLVAALAAALLALEAAAQAPHHELFSKRYQFRTGVTLEIAEAHASGLRLDTVEFELPLPSGDRLVRTGGLVTARVAVSNTGTESHRLGLAIALLDDDGRLLGVASGGNTLTPIKPGRQKTFTLVFDAVNAEAHRATGFQISLEHKP